MIKVKSLTWFLGISFATSWALFCVPLLFRADETLFTASMQISFILAMWGPGLAAILTTRMVDREPVISGLHLNRLGPKRYYLLAWILPPVLTILTLGTTLLTGAGQFDPEFSMMRDLLTKAPPGTELPPVEILVLIQLAQAVTLAPFINIIFALGEELGWRGYLLPRLLPLGQWRAILICGLIWGFWHAPTTLLYGYNFPQHPYLGVLVMMVGCCLLGTILAWLTLNTGTPWVAALAHGAVNASPGLAIFFLKPGFDTALGGLILGASGWIPMALFIAWLVWSKRLPVKVITETAALSSPQ